MVGPRERQRTLRLDRGIDWDELARIAQDAYAEAAPTKRQARL